MKICILVGVDCDGMMAATHVYAPLKGDSWSNSLKDAQEHICQTYDIDASSIQYRIVEAEVPEWHEPALPVVQGEVREVTP